MSSPFRTEAQAFRFVVLVAVGAGAVVAADRLAGTAVLVTVCILAAAAVAAAYLLGRPRPRLLQSAPAHLGPPGERRALLLLLDGAPDEAALTGLHERCDRLLVVAPAATSTLHHWVSDVDAARERARERMEDAVSRAQAAQLDASGVVGDEDPLAAVDDALRSFGADEVVAATGDPRLLAALRERYAIPVTGVA